MGGNVGFQTLPPDLCWPILGGNVGFQTLPPTHFFIFSHPFGFPEGGAVLGFEAEEEGGFGGGDLEGEGGGGEARGPRLQRRGGEEVVDWVDSRSARMGLEGMHRGYEEEKRTFRKDNEKGY